MEWVEAFEVRRLSEQAGSLYHTGSAAGLRCVAHAFDAGMAVSRGVKCE
jgi:hypothetical protein